MEFELSAINDIIEPTALSIDTNIDAEKQYKRQRGKPTPSRNHAKLQRRIADALHALYGEKYEILPEFASKIFSP